jgi:hypothetical protein
MPDADTHRPIYFSSADPGIEHSTNQKGFLNSLTHHLLFEPNGLVLPDSFIFDSSLLVAHLQTGPYPLFCRALSQGFITLAFRSERETTFAQSAEALDKAGILGMSMRREAAASLVRQLDKDLRSKKARIEVWPEGIGESFSVMLRELFAQSTLDTEDAHLNKIWRQLEDWRTVCVDKAEDVTRKRGGSGLRRAEMWNVIGWELGILPRDDTYARPGALIDSVKTTRNRQLLEQTVLFVDIVNTCYQRNQSARLAALHNIPPPLARGAAAALGRHWRHEAGAGDARLFDYTFTAPSAEALLKGDTSSILDVREGNEGRSYFNSREEWTLNPCEDTEHQLVSAASSYVATLNRFAKGPQREVRSVIARKAGRASAPPIVTSVTAYTMARYGLPPEAVFVTATAGVVLAQVNVWLDAIGPTVPKADFRLRIYADGRGPELSLPPATDR